MKKIINKKTLLLLSLLLFLPVFSGCFLTPSVNQTPTITSTSITTATVDELYTYNVNATDPDGDTLTYSLTTNPTGMTINSTTGVISWTPTSTQIGNNPVTVKAFDGALDDTQSFIIIVSKSPTPTPTPTHTYTVTYNANGGTGAVPVDASSPYVQGASVTVLGQGSVVRTGYTFDGWNTAANGTGNGGTDYAADDNFTMDTVNVTLYAQWTTGSVHNITQNIYYTAIQAALDAANSNDTIEVDDDTYAESITFPNGKVITLRSLNGASSTIITGVNGSDTVIFNGSLTGTILEGFTITHDAGMVGSGVSISDSNLTINECTISGNTTNDSGGGIYNDNYSTLSVTSSTISDNIAATTGGGIANYNYSTLSVTSSTISDNIAATYGGGIDNYEYSTLSVTSSTISDNTTNTGFGDGGGISNWNSTSTIISSTISGNDANYGGGIYNYSPTNLSTITSSTISGNDANYGGGIYNYSPSNLSTTSSTISGNNVSQQGGGIYLSGTGTITIGGISPADPDNNTFTDNKQANIVLADQHIRDSVGDVRTTYPYNVYTP